MKILRSSTGSGNLSLTIKGLLISLVPITIAILQAQGYSIAEADLTQAIDTVFTTIASVTVAVGLIRKIYLSATRK
jgi:hypothetical protein